MSTWNGKRFSVYTSDEKSALGLIKELGKQTNFNTDEVAQVKESNNKKVSHNEMKEIYKIDNNANFTGSWYGIKKPSASNEGMQTIVDELHGKSLSTEVNIKYPTAPFVGCDMTGKTDSTEKLKNILKNAVENYNHVKIIFPDGKLLITDTIEIDVLKISIECQAEILCDMSSDKYAFAFGTTKGNGDYSKGRSYYKGLFLQNVNNRTTENRSNGILFGGSWETLGSSNISFENCIIRDFNNGLTYADRSYLVRMNNCDIYGNNTQINIVGGDDTGENIKFTDCVIANGGTALYSNNEFATVFFNGCSIDYNYKQIFKIDKGNVRANNCHFEHSATHFLNSIPFEMGNSDGNECTITNSSILFTNPESSPTTLEYIIKNNYNVNAMSYFNINNCFLQGFKTTTGFIGTGLINMYANQCWQWDDMNYKVSEEMNKINDGHFFNADLNVHKDFIKYREPNNIEIFTKYHRKYEGDHWLAMKKITGYGTNGSACFLVPRNMLNTLFGGELNLCANKETTVDIMFGLCRYVDGKIVHEDLLYNVGGIGLSEVPIIKNLNGRQLSRNNNSCDHIFLEINMYNCNQNTEIYLKDMFIYEF